MVPQHPDIEQTFTENANICPVAGTEAAPLSSQLVPRLPHVK